MNYRDFGEGKKVDMEKLQKLVEASHPTELSEIASFWNFFRDDVLVGLVCWGGSGDLRNDYMGEEIYPRRMYIGDIIARVGSSIIKKRSSGLYLVEGVITPYFVVQKEDKNEKTFWQVRGWGSSTKTNFAPVSQLALPTDKFIPLYVNMYQNAGIMIPPMEFGRVD